MTVQETFVYLQIIKKKLFFTPLREIIKRKKRRFNLPLMFYISRATFPIFIFHFHKRKKRRFLLKELNFKSRPYDLSARFRGTGGFSCRLSLSITPSRRRMMRCA